MSSSARVQRLRPEHSIVIDELASCLERARFQVASRKTTIALSAEQSSSLEHVEVLADGGQRDGKRFGELTHQLRAASELRENTPTRRIGQRPEHCVEACVAGALC